MGTQYHMLQRLLEHQKNNTHTTIFRSITEEGQMLSLKASRRILLIYALCFYTELKEPCIYFQLKTNKKHKYRLKQCLFSSNPVSFWLIFTSTLAVESCNWLIRIQYKVYAELLSKYLSLLRKTSCWNSC